MADEPGQDVVRVLPHRLGDDDRQVGVDLGEHLEALLLAGDESVTERRVVRVGSLDLDAERARAPPTTCFSIASCAGQQVSLALWRRSPLAAIRTFFRGAMIGSLRLKARSVGAERRMSGEGKRSDWPSLKPPRPSWTLTMPGIPEML